jgi:hypothetical protein
VPFVVGLAATCRFNTMTSADEACMTTGQIFKLGRCGFPQLTPLPKA